MGLFDSVSDQIKGAIGQLESGTGPLLISTLLSKTEFGGLQGLINKLQKGGLGPQVQSWLGNGSNLPVTAEQLQAALGNEHVQQIARQLGLPVDAAMQMLAQYLPNAVDQASPDGKLPSAA